MPHYRIYSLKADGHYLGPAQVVECATDDDAVRKAQQFVNGCGVEVWKDADLVASLPSILGDG